MSIYSAKSGTEKLCIFLEIPFKDKTTNFTSILTWDLIVKLRRKLRLSSNFM